MLRLIAFGFLLFVVLNQCAEADNRVLVIGIDGAGGQYMNLDELPHLAALAANGAARLDFQNEGALTPNPPSGYGASGVNWSTILTGVGAATHGVSDNTFASSQFTTWPSMFRYVRQAMPTASTASISHWSPINTSIISSTDLDLEISGVSDQAVRDHAVDLLATGDPTAMFLHFDDVDHAGHTSGWQSAAYNTALANVDLKIGDIVAAMNARPGAINGTENWLVLVTSDHGGEGTSHFAAQGPINWDVPLIVSGTSVEDGSAMQRGTLRDVVPTALWHLGIDPFELNLQGTVRGLDVPSPTGVAGDINLDGMVFGNGSGLASEDDVTAFVTHWLAEGGGSIADRYQRGDINLDGVTNLDDWALLHRTNPSLANAIARSLAGHPVPEPASIVTACVALLFTFHLRLLQSKPNL
ncbi:alkaline phosphatase family protein [Aeoliella sp. SH292]|uniref:alkaline phosphatase family protein n=1 Tax=Aeoliella sp. SH292 TaxID=3454464 RepID=UPI003F9AF871